MKRRQFVTASLAASAALTTAQANPLTAPIAPARKQVYELRVYEFRFNLSQAGLNSYLTEGLIPALNRMGVKNVGVFTEMGKPEPAKTYVLIPYGSWEDYGMAATKLAADTIYGQVKAKYDALAPEKAPFVRYTTTLLNAFDGLPTLTVPKAEGRLFELRTYEGYSEDAVRRKVKMFNDEEIKVFNKTGLHPVFFGEVVAGEHMPCLTYMLTFKDMAERDANWKQFSADPDWKRVSTAPEYANTVSYIHRVFLEPAASSQI
ncbi:NIPSNAP family protein [Fibrella sp. WM1]|uniref:NIPSNAP family protein n=1 Tax=Fibrella musci TaxID=3242485 RepID=UPI0035221DA5